MMYTCSYINAQVLSPTTRVTFNDSCILGIPLDLSDDTSQYKVMANKFQKLVKGRDSSLGTKQQVGRLDLHSKS